MGTIPDYRTTGVSLVARALDCLTLSLIEQDLRGRVRRTTWDRTGEVTLRGWVVEPALLRALRRLTVLRPELDGAGGIVVTVQSPDLGLVGWHLVGTNAFEERDADAAARLVSVLADPAMRQPDRTHDGAAARPEARRRAAPAAPTLLTAREAEILALVGEGMTARAIAHRCGISERTVQKHLEQAYRKLDCHDRLSAVLLARDCGLLTAGRLVTVA